MFSLCRSPSVYYPLIVLAVILALAGYEAVGEDGRPPLRVCADPNNLPFSNEQKQGFENELAEFVARGTGRGEVQYTWWPQRRGFVRNTLKAGQCDLIMSVPADYEMAATTRPYYRSTYVFVYREDADFELESLDDPVLRELKVGVHMVGDDYANTPGAAALGRRGLIDNIVGFSIYGDYGQPHPPSRLIEAVAAGEVDAAIAWGPLAGYFGSRQDVPLKIVPVSPEQDGEFIPFAFDIAMGTRRQDERFRAELDRLIAEHGTEMRELLAGYGVPAAMPRPAVTTMEGPQ